MNTAIMLRGHARTWNTVKYQNLAFLNDCYNKPDWFVMMPTGDTVTVDTLNTDFYRSNLVSCQLIDDKLYNLPFVQIQRWDSYCPEYWKLAWLDYQISIAIRQHELKTGVRYNQVLFARPDCSYTYVENRKTTAVSSMEVATILTHGSTGTADQSDPELADDLCYVAGRAAAGLLMTRYLESQWQDLPNQLIHPNPCALLASFCMRHSIIVNIEKRFIQPTLVRPQYIGYTEWSQLDTSTKINICDEFNIDPKDYQLII